MSRNLDDHQLSFKWKVFEFLARLVEAKVIVTIICTKRTEAEHQANLAAGTSWTRHSKHIDGWAIDVAPTHLLKEPNWAPDDPLWLRMGVMGERCGLSWGGRWKKKDFCHFEEPA